MARCGVARPSRLELLALRRTPQQTVPVLGADGGRRLQLGAWRRIAERASTAGFVELRSAHQQQALGPVVFTDSQADKFPAPQARRVEQHNGHAIDGGP